MPDPIVQRLPETTRAVTNKYNDNPGLLSGAPSPIRNALVALDIQRAGKGQNPLSARQTQLALQAALSNTASTKPPSGNLLENFVGDIKNLTASVPRLPAAIFQEIKNLPQAPEAISEALAQGNLPDVLKGLFVDTPGLRMVPGAYVAGHALSDPGELARHPLFTMLDVLPAKQIPGVAAGIAKGKAVIKPRVTPIVKALGQTRPGQLAKDTFSPLARDVSQLYAEGNETLRRSLDPEGRPSTDPLTLIARRATSFRAKYPHIAEDRQISLMRMMQEDADAIRTLPAEELAFVNEARTITDELGEVGVSEDLLTRIDGELYDNETASKILRARRAAMVGRDFANVRGRILEPDNDIPGIIQAARDITLRDDLKPGGKLKLIEGYAHALESNGYDASPILDAIRKSRKGYSDDAIRSVVDAYVPTPRASLPLNEALDTLTKIARTDPIADRLLTAIRKERWQEAKGLAKRLSTRTKHAIPDIDSIIDRTATNAKQQRWLNSTRKYDEKAVVRTEAAAGKIFARNPPARFQPVVERKIQERLVEQFSEHPDFDTILPYLKDRHYGWLRREGLISEAEFRTIQRDIQSTWTDLKAGGYDPVFVHKVSPTSLPRLEYPRILERVEKPSQVTRRSNDISPAIDDISIAMSHQAMEWLARRGDEEFVEQILSKWGRSEADLIDQYLPAARIRAQTKRQLDPLGHAQQMMAQEFGRYNPEAIINWPSPRIQRWKDEQVWLPKTVINTIQRMHTPPAGRLTAIFDPIMKVFRTALLPLSLRWHVYNILGGGILLTTRTDPTVWKYLAEAKKMGEGIIPERLPADITERIPHGLGTMPDEIIEWNAKASFSDKIGAAFHNMGGATMGRLWDQTQAARIKAGKAIQWSYDKNAMIDDLYRSMALLYGFDKGITKGLTSEAAQHAGIELSRKIMQNWDRMTPIERTIMRYVFPFYGWMNHIIRYTLSYPFDHPYRTAIMGSFARNELEDMGDALPERFLNMFFLGDMDKNGNVKSLNLAGMNPFRDVANYFTLAGFMGQTNPVITSLLESAGLDPTTGGPELFPNLRYDTETGRLKADTPNPIQTFIQATLPQSRILFGFADRSSEFQELLRSNPESAARLLRSQAGLPIIFRNVNIPQEIAKTEISRDENQTQALNDALRSGDYSAAEKYPGLAPILDQIRTLDKQGALDQFKPSEQEGLSEGQSKIGLAQEALVRMNLP